MAYQVDLYVNSNGYSLYCNEQRIAHSTNIVHSWSEDAYALMWQTFNDAVDLMKELNFVDRFNLTVYSDERITEELSGEVVPLSLFATKSLSYFIDQDMPRVANFKVFKTSKELILKK